MNYDQRLKKELFMQIEHVRHFYTTKESISTQSRKIKFNKNLTRPVATYRAENWTLNEDFVK
jgi:hypothetical protein